MNLEDVPLAHEVVGDVVAVDDGLHHLRGSRFLNKSVVVGGPDLCTVLEHQRNRGVYGIRTRPLVIKDSYQARANRDSGSREALQDGFGSSESQKAGNPLQKVRLYPRSPQDGMS